VKSSEALDRAYESVGERIIADFEAVENRVIYVDYISGFVSDDYGEEQVYLDLDEPLAVRVLSETDTDTDLLCRHDPKLVDSYWLVDVVDGAHPELPPGFRPWWCYGHTYRLTDAVREDCKHFLGRETWRQWLRRKFNRRPFWRPEDKKGVS
jgi:hypothetical protein